MRKFSALVNISWSHWVFVWISWPAQATQALHLCRYVEWRPPRSSAKHDECLRNKGWSQEKLHVHGIAAFLAFLELCTLRLEENVLARPAARLCHLMWVAITGCLLASRCPVCPVCREVSTFLPVTSMRSWMIGSTSGWASPISMHCDSLKL